MSTAPIPPRDFLLGDTLARYATDSAGRAQLQLLPAALAGRAATRRQHLDTPEARALPAKWQPIGARSWDSLVQIKIRGEGELRGRAQGRTLRNTPSTQDLKLADLAVSTTDDVTTVLATLRGAAGWTVEHRLSWRTGDRALTSTTRLSNTTAAPITVEHLSSFSLNGLSPFASDLGTGRLHLHRFRSAWAAEGRHERLAAEALHLEPAWAPFAARSERYGQIGSTPVNGFFPWGAVEDAVAGVFWGAQLCLPGSWQLEFYRQGDELNFSGGLADRDFGLWWKTLAPGEAFETPPAWLAVVAGTLDDLCDRLTAQQTRALASQPASERDLPILFNEFCTSWGSPTHDAMLAAADRLAGTPVKICVVDDGWAERPPEAVMQSNGDWIVDRQKFPGGLRPTFNALRARNLAPGVWFEFEVCNPGSAAWDCTHHQLHRDGVVLRVGGRRFWDFRAQATHDFLAEKVIALLRDSGAAYLKVDYNENLGVGCDGTESPGEGLRQHLQGVQRFFRRLREELPDLLIENCSSGGHRLEPSMLGLCAMGSFSDAHESPEIPIIAANLQRLILPRQSQVWAVLRAADTPARLAYSLAATFLGRCCLSGEIHALSPEQWTLVRAALDFYTRAVPLIRDGSTRVYQENLGPSWREPSGWQAVVRTARDGSAALVVVHTFACTSNATLHDVRIPIAIDGNWCVSASFAAVTQTTVGESSSVLRFAAAPFTGTAFLVSRS